VLAGPRLVVKRGRVTVEQQHTVREGVAWLRVGGGGAGVSGVWAAGRAGNPAGGTKPAENVSGNTPLRLFCCQEGAG